FYTPVPLNVAAFDQYQERTVTDFQPDGITPAESMAFANITAGRLHTPRSATVNAELDRELSKDLIVRVTVKQRRKRRQPIVSVTPNALLLDTDGRSRYREGQVTMRYQFHGRDQIVASYTRSSAVGDLNDFNTYFGNIQNPVVRANQYGPLPWDAPNRWLFW